MFHPCSNRSISPLHRDVENRAQEQEQKELCNATPHGDLTILQPGMKWPVIKCLVSDDAKQGLQGAAAPCAVKALPAVGFVCALPHPTCPPFRVFRDLRGAV